MISSGSTTRKIIVCAFHTSLLTSLEDYLASREIEFLYLGRNLKQQMSHKICQQFAGVPSYKVLLIDSSSINFTQHFYFLKGSFPFGVPILFCESTWNVPKFEEPTYRPGDEECNDDEGGTEEGAGDPNIRQVRSSQESQNRTSQPPKIYSQQS